MAEFVGGPIDSGVVKQLEQRVSIFKKTTKTPDDIHYLNSRNAWVRVISSVNQVTLKAISTSAGLGTVTESDSTKAKNFVLSNLTEYDNTSDSFNLRSGIDFNSSNNSKTAYSYSEDAGVRPRPGITSFSVICKGRFGTIREANVAFSVWSVQDLEAIERLYFAPGYSCIIEWGHSIYVDNQGNVQKNLSEANTNLKDYFDDSKKFSDINTILENKKDKTSNNYQSFVGFIKNFSWSFRPDGGYDCSISVISHGEVLESLKMNVDTTVSSDFKENRSSKISKNLIYEFIENLRDAGNLADLFRRVVSGPREELVNISNCSTELQNILNQIPEIGKVGNNIALGRYNNHNTGKGNKFFYFPLRTLIFLLNKGFAVKTENCEIFPEIKTLSNQKFFTFKDHFSVDPLTCILIKNLTIQRPGQAGITSFNTSIPPYTSLTTSVDSILDILITDILVERALENSNENVKVFLEYILQQITESLGNVNEFVIYETDNLGLEIKDVALSTKITTEQDNAVSKSYTLPLSGLKSTLTDLSIQSKISKNLTAMISIAAQRGPGKTAEDIEIFTEWNKGREDRFAGDKTQDSQNCDEFQAEVAKKEQSIKLGGVIVDGIFYRDRPGIENTDYLKKFVAFLINTFSSTDKTFLQIAYTAYSKFTRETANDMVVSYDSELFNTLKEKAPTYFKSRLFNSFLIASESSGEDKDKIAKGVIPVELSFKTDGIGGLKIGQAFRVSTGVLPSRYDEFGYIIVGLDHSIENNRWYTNVRSQMYIIPGEVKTGNASITVPDFNTVPSLPFNTSPSAPLTSDEVEGVTRTGTVLPPVSEEISLAGPLSSEIQVKYRKLISDFAERIARFEGFFASNNNLAFRNNNPGNLRSWGTNPVVDGFAKFNSLEEGWNALYRQINLNIGRNLSFLEFFAGKPGSYPGYAPSADNNNPGTYASFVTNRLPGNPNTRSIISNYFKQVYSKA